MTAGLMKKRKAELSYPRKNASTCAAHSAGFSNGAQCPQLLSSTSA